MANIMFVLHLLFAIFAIGPLVHAATTASRGVRRGDATATAESARMARVYALTSIGVVVFGMGLAGTDKDHGQLVAHFGDTWVWLSAVLWLVAVAITMAVTVPALNQATAAIASGSSAKPLTGRVAASGGTVGLIFAVVVVLMVYKPGR